MQKRATHPMHLFTAMTMIVVLGTTISPLFTPSKPRTCFDNMRQISQALSAYSDHFDDRFPRSYEYQSMSGGGYRRVNWSARLKPYLASTMDVFHCPADPMSKPVPQNGRFTDLQAPIQSYLPNYAVLPTGLDYLRSVSGNEIRDPSALIAFAERQSKLGSKTLKAYAGASAFVPDSPLPGQPYRRVTLTDLQKALGDRSDKTIKLVRVAWKRHSGLSNFAFVDGHVRALPAGSTLDPARPIWGEMFYPSAR